MIRQAQIELICSKATIFYDNNPCGDYERDVRHFIYEMLNEENLFPLSLEELKLIEFWITNDGYWLD